MDLSPYQSLFQESGPFATVLLDVSHDRENGGHEHALRVRAACDALRGQGADEQVVEMVRERLSRPVAQPAPVGRLVVVSVDGVKVDEVVGARIEQATHTWAALPDLAAWIVRRDATVRFVLAVVDHVGGDVAVMDSDVPEPGQVDAVGGETHHVHQVPVGGWSALRYQHVTENVWAENARAVAERITEHLRSGPDLVLLAGDPQSRPLVIEALGDAPHTLVQLDTGTRADDGGDQAHQQAVREALMDAVVARRTAVVHEVRARQGQGSGAATGIAEVAEAFVRGQVDTLLLDPTAAAEVALDPRQHRGLVLGPGGTGPVRADLGLVAAAAATSSHVVVLPAAALGGEPVAALLRWDQRTAS